MPRLFLAAWPDAATCSALEALPRPEERGIRWVPPDNWHVTVRFLGEADLDEVRERLTRVVLPATDAFLGPAIESLGPQLVAPARGVDELAAAVAAATADLGEPPRQDFHGHLTIARLRRGARSSVLGHPISSQFTIDRVTLVRSDLHPDGAQYTTVASYPTE